jgi:hypothetical protein
MSFLGKAAIPLALLTICLCASEHSAQKFKQFPGTHKKGLESINLCLGNDIRPDILNPKCYGWPPTSLEAGDLEWYGSTYPSVCFENGDGGLKCYFRTAFQYCNAFALNQQTLHPANNTSNYIGAEVKLSVTKYACTYCYSYTRANGNPVTEEPNRKGYCPNGLHEVDRADIPTSDYSPHCTLEVNGPYSNIPDSFNPCGTPHTEPVRGMIFTKEQRDRIKYEINEPANGFLKSDLAGFCYPKPKTVDCIEPHPTKTGFCVEPSRLNESPGQKDSAEVHHVIPKKDSRSCPCGANANRNAAVISKQLNLVFLNRDRTSFVDCNTGKNELETVNALPKYEALPAAPSPRPPSNAPRKQAQPLKKRPG